MVKTPEEIIESLKAKIGEDTSDESIELLENVTDTLTDYENRTKDSTNWEQKFKDNDKRWREKYRDRFFNSEADEEFEDESPRADIVKFEDLFKEE